MKRTALKRKTPLKRSTKPLKKTPLARKSKKQARLEYAVRKLRKEYKQRHAHCQCERDCRLLPSELHEIPAGAQFRWKAIRLPSCWLFLSATCHRRLQGAPYEIQIACKLLHDPEDFDLFGLLEVLGRARTAITIEEVLSAMPKKLPTAEEIRHDLRDVERHMEMLRRQLADKDDRRLWLLEELGKALVREQKISESRIR